MKKHLILSLICLLSLTATASTLDTIRPPRPKVGVVLGGGGAKGACHIGVLKYLEEMGIPVDYVAGTSMGSIIGGMYAMGYSPDELATIIAQMDWSSYVGNNNDRRLMAIETRQRNSTCVANIPFGLEDAKNMERKSLINTLPSAYVNNASLINLFNNLCIGYQQDVDFNDLPIPFACVATDVASGEEVVIRSGSVPTAMRASMAIPGVFSPVTIDGHVLVDGGLVNNFPADVLREMGADIVIGVEVTNQKSLSAEDLQSMPALLGKLFQNIVSAKREANRQLCDLWIVPDITGYGMLSFSPSAIDTLVRRGYNKANEYHDQFIIIKNYIEKLAGGPVAKEFRAPKAANFTQDSILIRSINMNETSEKQSKWLIRKGGLRVGTYMTSNDVENAINIYRGTGAFDGITYNIMRDETGAISKEVADEAYDLTLTFKPAKPHVVGIGLRYDTEEGAALLFRLGLNDKKLSGVKLDLSTRLSFNPKVSATLSYSSLALASFNLACEYQRQTFKIAVTEDNFNLGYQDFKVDFFIKQFHLLNLNAIGGISYTYTHFDEVPNTAEYPDIDFETNKLLTPYFDIEYDNMNDSYFATCGTDVRLHAGIDIDYQQKRCSNANAFFVFKKYLSAWDGAFTIIPQAYARIVYGRNDYANQLTFIGNDIFGRHLSHQIPFVGISGSQVLYNDCGILRCDMRFNPYGKHYLYGMFNYAYARENLSAGVAKEQYFGAGVKYSYNSPIGPISLTGQWSNIYYRNPFSVYFSLGYAF